MDIDVMIPIQNWYYKNESNGVTISLIPMISFLFLILDSLNKEIEKLPLRSISGQNYKTISNSEVIIIGIFLNPLQYSTLRSILSLTGDVYNICNSLLISQNLMDLRETIKNIFDCSNKFREL